MRVREVQVRYLDTPATIDGRRVLGPEAVVEVLRDLAISDNREHFVALYLNARHRLLAVQTVHIGTLDQSLVHPREVFQPAVLLGAGGVIVAHNHPSGNPEPSTEDAAVTDRLATAGTLLGIPLLDSIVWTRDGGYVSFARRGLLSKDVASDRV